MPSGHLAKLVVILVYIPRAALTNLANIVSDGVMWDNRGTDVSRVYMYICIYIYVCMPAFVYVYIHTFILNLLFSCCQYMCVCVYLLYTDTHYKETSC